MSRSSTTWFYFVAMLWMQKKTSLKSRFVVGEHTGGLKMLVRSLNDLERCFISNGHRGYYMMIQQLPDERTVGIHPSFKDTYAIVQRLSNDSSTFLKRLCGYCSTIVKRPLNDASAMHKQFFLNFFFYDVFRDSLAIVQRCLSDISTIIWRL